MNDPMFLFSKSVAEESASLEKQLAVFDAPFAIARKAYLEGILSMDGPYAYFPDANLTLRLSYGQVKGYKPGDAIYYAHQTTLDGVIEKEDPPGNWEFVVPAMLKKNSIRKKISDITQCITATCLLLSLPQLTQREVTREARS